MSAVLAPPESPYKGLAPFEDTDEDALLFFGREHDSDAIAANVLASRLTVLFGPSGVGKSSLLRAGVARRLRTYPDVAVVVHDRWSGDPLTTLLRAVDVPGLARPRVDLPPSESLDEWTRAHDLDLVLLLDQFEELFAYHSLRNGGATAAAGLGELASRPDLRVNVLVAVREDALATLDVLTGRVPSVFGNYVRLDRLDREAGRAAIEGPLGRWNALSAGAPVGIEAGLVEAVLDGTAGADGVEAPYLQLVMQRVWEVERAEGSELLRRATLERLGGPAAIVRQHLGGAVAALGPAGRAVAASVFHHLVTPSGTKIAHGLDDLAGYGGVATDELGPVLDELGRRRILRPLDGGRYEIFHDVLADPVVAWRNAYAADARLAQERRRQRRLLAAAGGLLALLVVMTGIAVYALAQRTQTRQQAAIASEQRLVAQRQAERAEAQQDAAEDATADARRESRNATRQAGVARRALAEARTQERLAQAQRAEAQRLAREAAAQRSRAERSSGEALRQAAEVARQRTRAEEQAAAARTSAAAAVEERERAELERARAEAESLRARQEGRRAELQRLRAEREATRARVGELTQRALALLDVDPEEGLRSSLAASRLAQNSVVEGALRRSLLALRLRARLPGGGGAVTASAFSSDGRYVLIGSEQGGARLFRAGDARRLHALPHQAAVTAASFDAGGTLVLTGSADGVARLWSRERGTLVRSFAHGGPLTAAILTPDGRFVLTGGSDAVLRIWDAASGSPLHRIALRAPVRTIALSPDGRLAVPLTTNPRVGVVEVETGRTVATFQQPAEIRGGAYAPDGDTVVTIGPRNAYVWDSRVWTLRHTLEGHGAAIRDASYSPDGTAVATVGVDGVGRLWNVETGRLENLLSGHSNTPQAVAFSPDGTLVVTGGSDRTGRIWSRARIGAVPLLLAGHTNTVTDVAFAPGGRVVLTASRDGTARLWDVAGDPVLRLLGRHDGAAAITSTSTSSDGRLVLTAAADGTARLWRASGGEERVFRHGGRVVRAAFGHDEQTVLTWGDDGTARVWRAATGVPEREFRHGAAVAAAAVSADGTLVVTAGADGVARVWSSGGAPLATLRHGTGSLTAAVFAPRGGLLVTGGADRTVRLWDARSGRLRHVLGGHRGAIAAVAFSPDGRRLVTAAADDVGRLWDVERGTLRAELTGHDAPLTSVAFSPDGRLVLTASRDGEPRTWDAFSGEAREVFTGHVATVAEARFSPDGRWVVTAGPSAVGLWRTEDASFVFFLRGENVPVRAVAFAAGERIVAGSSDGSVRAYTCAVCRGLPALQSMAAARLRQLDARARAAAGRD